MQNSEHPARVPSSSVHALRPRHGRGHQFVCYGDCTSGVPGAPHAETFAAVNHVISRLDPSPEFVCFLGDEVKGLVADPSVLREQWKYWWEKEMAWLDCDLVPLYHVTGNHTTYDAASEAVFREVLSHLPRNGPPGQEGLSYFVRRGDLLLVFVNTMWSGLGDGRVETDWLDRVLAVHAGARYKLVLGHHPAYPINGFSGDYQRHLNARDRDAFWDVLIRHGVLAYICSHIMAFDVQVHRGVLQLTTAGAGTLPLMPEDVEYLHCVQVALDVEGLRYEVLDTAGETREWLTWPVALPSSEAWNPLTRGEQPAPPFESMADTSNGCRAQLVVWRFDGVCPSKDEGSRSHTLLSAWTPGPPLAPLWIGLQGPERRVSLLLSAAPGRSHHYWLGPTLTPGQPFSIQLAIHTGMGPGGILWRWDDSDPWSSMIGATPWGGERLAWPTRWSVGHDQHGPKGRPFGQELCAWWHSEALELNPADNPCNPTETR